MNLKKSPIWALLIVVSASLVFAAPYRRPIRRVSSSAFQLGDMILTPEIMVSSGTVPIGANFEYAFTKNIGLGGDLVFSLEGSGAMTIAPDVSYHFNMNTSNFDLFAGGGPALIIGFNGGSAFGFKPFLGSRFYFTPKIAAYFKFFALLAKDSSIGGAFGVSFKI
jgi:hypothetical protein